MKRVIKWQSQHLEIDTITGKIHESDEENDDLFENYDDLDYDEEGQHPIQNVMSTPFGIWRVDDSMHPYKQFKLWMGHTNFSITKRVAKTLKTVPGVEVLQIMTRYRFMIGIGEMFEFSDVRVAIEKTLACNQNESDMIGNNEILEQIHELRDTLAIHDRWAIYVFPNGQIDFTTSEQQDFIQQLGIFRQAVDHSNGVLIESENE